MYANKLIQQYYGYFGTEENAKDQLEGNLLCIKIFNMQTKIFEFTFVNYKNIAMEQSEVKTYNSDKKRHTVKKNSDRRIKYYPIVPYSERKFIFLIK